MRRKALIVGLFFLMPAFVCAVERDIHYESLDKRDPFVPLIGKEVEIQNVQFLKSEKDLMIEGVLTDEKKGSVVVVNGQVLKIGNFIGGFEVARIEADKVVFSREGKEYEISYGIDEQAIIEESQPMFKDQLDSL